MEEGRFLKKEKRKLLYKDRKMSTMITIPKWWVWMNHDPDMIEMEIYSDRIVIRPVRE